MNVGGAVASGRLINLLVPGGGLILIGSETMGVLVALLFTAAATFAIAAVLLFPDDVLPTWRGLGIGVAIGTYLGAQIRYAQTVRSQREQAAEERRRVALEHARRALLAGRVDDAWQALQPLVERAESDLVLAYRLAQVLTARGDVAGARAAWRRVRRLDRHRLYRQEVVENKGALPRS
ncbi:MAG: hypothetical protein ACE5I3_06980 [Phycisphaerae bacterium]